MCSIPAAVFFEQGEYEQCVEICERAVERGREVRADYLVPALTEIAGKLIAK